MTSNDFIVTNRTVLKIAIPMTLAYLSTPLLGIVDTAVIGQLGIAALIGGIALGGIIFDIVFTTFNCLRSGTTGLTAQAFGANEKDEIVAVLYRALVIAIVAGGIVIGFHAPILRIGLQFLGGSEAVQEATREYYNVRIYSAPFLLANYVILGWLLGLGRAMLGLFIQTFLNGLNIILSILFVKGFALGVTGVALATVLSEFITLLLGIVVAFHIVSQYTKPSWRQILSKNHFVRLINLNRDIMIRSFSLLFAIAFFTARSASQGDTILAANAILEKFFIFAAFFLDGFAIAAEQIAGRAFGAKNYVAFKSAVKLTIVWGAFMSLFIAVILLIFGNFAIEFMTTNHEIAVSANSFLIWAALTPLFGVLAFQMDGVYIGATWTSDMRNMMLLSLVLYLLSYFALFPLFGNHGLWFSFNVFLGIRGITLLMILPRRTKQTFQLAQKS